MQKVKCERFIPFAWKRNEEKLNAGHQHHHISSDAFPASDKTHFFGRGGFDRDLIG
jgi:hypothetical protein